MPIWCIQLDTAERKEEIEQWLEEDRTKYYLSGQSVADFNFSFFYFSIFSKFSKVKKKNYHLSVFNKN